jgi:hypothetical protein
LTHETQRLRLAFGLSTIALLCPIVYGSCAAPEEITAYGDPSLDPPEDDGGGGSDGEATSTESTMGGANVVTVTIGSSNTSDTESSTTATSTTASSTASTTATVTTAVTTSAATTGSGGSGGTGSMDECPDDPDKTEPGACGCGNPDTDSDADDTADCNDECPDDPDKTEPGACGCGNPDDANCTALANALIHRYSFTGSGNTVADLAGNADATLVGASQSGGQVTMAAGQYVQLPSAILSGLSAVTIEVWYNWNGGGAWQRVFDFGVSDAGAGSQGAGESYLFFTPKAVDDAGVARAAFTPSGGPTNEVYADAANASLNGTMVHAAVVFGGGNLALYTSGALEDSVAVSDPLSAVDDSNNWLGWSQFEADPGYVGTIREFRMYDAALSAAQIQASFSLGPDAPLGN